MKIALVVPGGVDRSGEYRVIPALLALLKRLSMHHELHVFALRQEATPGDWMLAGAHVHNIGGERTRPRTVIAIMREHRMAPFHVVHSIWSGACGVVAVSAARVLRIPSVVHIAGGELIALPDISYGGRQNWQGRVREAMVLRAASVVTAPSVPIIEQIAALGVSAHRVPLSVDLNEWPPRKPVRRDTRERARLIHVASLNRIKDQSTLLRAMAVLVSWGMDVHMDIVGEDTLNGEIHALARALGLAGRVEFHGFVPQRQLRPLVMKAHLMVISSRHEAGPIAMLEAAAVGVPTVGTAVGHIAEWSPSASVAVPVGDWNELAAAIRRALADEDLRLHVAHAAAQRVMGEDADYTATQLQSIYRRLTDVG
ncbi:MAG TPA: glycosyltransferase [Steroidobacter sp.]|uniref:glycosyltransferase family 4 protein n=1 Tax=Steroidobacter sp. TaxID=1978227 RepID=UPI002ED8012E